MSNAPTPVIETEQDGRQGCSPRHRSVALLELITTAALALCTAVAATAVSIGIARADVSPMSIGGESPGLAVALGIGMLLWAAPALGAMTGRRASEL